jgi:hypothetical protein
MMAGSSPATGDRSAARCRDCASRQRATPCSEQDMTLTTSGRARSPAPGEAGEALPCWRPIRRGPGPAAAGVRPCRACAACGPGRVGRRWDHAPQPGRAGPLPGAATVAATERRSGSAGPGPQTGRIRVPGTKRGAGAQADPRRGAGRRDRRNRRGSPLPRPGAARGPGCWRSSTCLALSGYWWLRHGRQGGPGSHDGGPRPDWAKSRLAPRQCTPAGPADQPPPA